jgi:hypothetical protein
MGADASIFWPKWLIAPYFPIRKSLAWLDTNLKCLGSAVSQNPDSCTIIAVELAALRENWQGIADSYSGLKPKALFLDRIIRRGSSGRS